MTVSKKLTLSADGATAAVADATLSDVFTTAISTNEAITGLYGVTQKALLFIGGMSFQNYRRGGGFNPFSG